MAEWGASLWIGCEGWYQSAEWRLEGGQGLARRAARL